MSFKIRFWGVRGSYPVATTKGFDIGGNTTCLEIEAGNHIIIIDAGTGIIKLGKMILKRMRENKERNKELVLFFTHYHQDHTQGLPFFSPVYMPNVKIYFCGPTIGGSDVFGNLRTSMYPPFFPVNFHETMCKKEFFNVAQDDVFKFDPNDSRCFPTIGEKYIEATKENDPEKLKITANKNYIHPKDGSFYYVIEYKNKKVTFATDVEGFVGGDQRLIRAAKGSDYLIHDTQYLPDVYLSQTFTTQGFGHSTPSISADVARQAEVKNLVLTHHDPDSNDQLVKKVQSIAKKKFKNTIYAYEVMEIDVLENKISAFTGL
jgi:phosphoribosyl 1,2-cyclic phosphodiesterase